MPRDINQFLELGEHKACPSGTQMHILKKRIIIRGHRAILDVGTLNCSKPFVSGLNGKRSREDTKDSALFHFKRKSKWVFILMKHPIV